MTRQLPPRLSESMSRAQSTGQPVVPIIIDSYGGQVYSLMSMISDIQHSKIPVATIVQGKAVSCGAILFSFGPRKRYMDPKPQLWFTMLAQWPRQSRRNKSNVRKPNAQKKIYHMMAQNWSKMKIIFLILNIGHADWFLDAKECKKYKLANHLRVPDLKIDTSVKITFVILLKVYDQDYKNQVPSCNEWIRISPWGIRTYGRDHQPCRRINLKFIIVSFVPAIILILMS